MAAVTAGQQQSGVRWQTLWTVLIAVFWGLIVIGVIGDYFFNLSFFGFKANGKLWDWLQLLSAPVFVTALPFIFKRQQSEHKVDEQQNQAAPPVADDRQQETTMETYLNHMSELLLEKNLRRSQAGDDVQVLAQALTLAALRRVDKTYKGAVLQFLHEASLVYKDKAIIDLREADLRWADLNQARLNGIDLAEVDLSEARLNRTNLSFADLRGANLSGADLREANLSQTDLSQANLLGANLRGAIYTREQLSKARAWNSIIQ